MRPSRLAFGSHLRMRHVLPRTTVLILRCGAKRSLEGRTTPALFSVTNDKKGDPQTAL